MVLDAAVFGCLSPTAVTGSGHTLLFLLSMKPPSRNGLRPFTAEGALASPSPVLAIASPLVSRLFPRGLTSCLSPSQPEDLEAPKTHHFKVKTFKKVKPCGICRQVITGGLYLQR